MNHQQPPHIGWHIYGQHTGLQTPFDVAVIMPTILRDTIVVAVNSVFAQISVGRIQLLIGIDVVLGNLNLLHELLETTPPHVTVCVFYPGYSTSTRHGGVHLAHDGGAMRTMLSYLANAAYITYLDDDNWWAPNHLSTMLKAIQGSDWAFALRWFVHPESRLPVCIDDWESVGPGRGDFVKNFGGWVDPNCLMIDKRACEPVLGLWSIPLANGNALLSDRNVYDWLQKKSRPAESCAATVFYTLQANDINQPHRLKKMGLLYEKMSKPFKLATPRVTAITTCKNRLHHLKQTLPLLANNPLLEVIVVDYACPQGTASWVRENYPNVKVVEVNGDAGFNVARARNFGAKAAKTPWLLFIDADVKVVDGFASWLKDGLSSNGYYMTKVYGTELTGSFFFLKQVFDLIGGYDEAIDCWGGEDEDLYHRLNEAKQALRHYPSDILVPLSHGEEERFLAYPGTNRVISLQVNQWYLTAKYDLMAIHNRSLTLEERQYLRRLVSDMVNIGIKDGDLESREMYLNLGERLDVMRHSNSQLVRRLIYQNSPQALGK